MLVRCRGVMWSKQREQWQARIQKDVVVKHLGFFDDETDAARAYNTAAINLFGDFAHPNAI